MTYVHRLLNSSLRHAGLLLLLGALTLGLTGCYTQLKVADTGDNRRVDRKTTYADEYRREYRREHRRSDRAQERATYEYNYYFSDYGWYSGWRYDPFFHDSWGGFHDPLYRPGFSFSLHVGSPYFYPWRYRPWYYSGFGYGPDFYGAYYGNPLYGDVYYYRDSEPDRNYTPRGGTIGRGSASADRRAADRSVTRSSATVNTRARAGRIGRSRKSGRTTRIERSGRSERSRSGRIGRSSRNRNDRTRVRRTSPRRPNRTTRTRPSRTETRDRSTQTRSGRGNRENSSGSRGRSRNRGGSAEDSSRGLRSDARVSPIPNRGRIGQRTDARRLTRFTRDALPTRIQVPDFERIKARIERQRRERRSFQFDTQHRDRSNPFDDRRVTRSRSVQQRASPSPSRTRSSGTDSSSSRSSGNEGGRNRSRGGGGR